MEAKASVQMIRIAPRKVRLVLDLVRGKDYNHAVAILKNLNRGAAKEVLKVINSCKANAEHNFNMDVNKLYVKTAMVCEGPTLKRFRARAKGSASSIMKRTSHITIVVAEKN